MQEPRLIHQGKVRDVYEDDHSLYLVATDRISAFDVILPNRIPDKGLALTQLSRFWFENLPADVAHHALDFNAPASHPEWAGRVTHCRRLRPVKVECVARGYLAGSAWTDYRETGAVQGCRLREGLRESDPLDTPLFTPTTKADAGHDVPLTEAEARAELGDALYETLRDLTLRLYQWAHDKARERGILIADTKLEFGWDPSMAAPGAGGDGAGPREPADVVLMDEIFTSDSSRFWPLDDYQPGRGQHSFDKQYVRDYLLSLKDWNRQPPGPELPEEIIRQTRARYIEAYERITGKQLNH